MKNISIFILFIIIFSCKDKDTNILENKTLGIHAAFYNNSGSKIALSTINGKLFLTDDKLKLSHSTQSDSITTNSSFFSLDDKFVVTGGNDKKIKKWNADNLNLEAEFNFDLNSYTTICGYTSIAGCGNNGKVVFYNQITKDTLFFQLQKQGAYHIYFISPDSSAVVSSGKYGYELNFIENEISHIYKGHNDEVYCIMPDNTNTKIVTASKDSTIKVFDRFTQEELHTSQKLNDEVYVACFSNDNNTIAASTKSGSIYFFDSSLSIVKMKIQAFEGKINCIHYSPNKDEILAASDEGGAKIFSTITGELLHELVY